MDTDTFRKAIHFDLDTQLLKEEFGPKNTSLAYQRIKSYLEGVGFRHSQYSGYMSIDPMPDYELFSIYENMKEKLPWIEKCAQRIHVLVVADNYDLLGFNNENEFDNNINQPESAKEEMYQMPLMEKSAEVTDIHRNAVDKTNKNEKRHDIGDDHSEL